MQGKGETQSGPAQALEENRAAISKLARSGDARRLMELLHRDGGVEQAAQAAAAQRQFSADLCCAICIAAKSTGWCLRARVR